MICADSMHLLLETAGSGSLSVPRPGASTRGPEDPARPLWLEIPPGVSYLTMEKDGYPRLDQDPPEGASGFVLLEPISWDQGDRVLAINMRPKSLRVNGKIAPPVILLKAGDELLFSPASGYVAHVAVFNSGAVGTLSDEETEVRCAICLNTFEMGARVYVCPGCKKPFHLDSEDQPEETRLVCARPGNRCPICRTPMNFEAGYTEVPECFRGH